MPGRSLPPEPKNGTRLAARVWKPRRNQNRHRCIHRWVLQLRMPALRIGQSAALRLRAELNSKKTYRCVRNYLTTTPRRFRMQSTK